MFHIFFSFLSFFLNVLPEKQNLLGSNFFFLLILVCVYTVCQHGQMLIFCTIPVDHLSHPVIPTLVFLWCQFAAFAYYGITISSLSFRNLQYSSANYQFLLLHNFALLLIEILFFSWDFSFFSHIKWCRLQISLVFHLNYYYYYYSSIIRLHTKTIIISILILNWIS